jgi:putative transposase
VVKKKVGDISLAERFDWVGQPSDLSIRRQCGLAGIARSSWYYTPCGESEENLMYMRMIDEQYVKTPFYGVPRMCQMLRRSGYLVNEKRVSRLMQLMGIQAIYAKKNLSKPAPGHKIYPYLLRGVKIERPDQVWSTDITYIRMMRGFLYLCAVIDWYSRLVLSWRLSNTLDGDFCIETLRDALGSGAKPEIFNTDQGSQFTSPRFTEVLLKQDIKISMDGRGRALDNVFIERLWRDVKYEHVFLHEYENGKDLYKGLKNYFHFRNEERPHENLGYKIPKEVYYQKQLIVP